MSNLPVTAGTLPVTVWNLDGTRSVVYASGHRQSLIPLDRWSEPGEGNLDVIASLLSDRPDRRPCFRVEISVTNPSGVTLYRGLDTELVAEHIPDLASLMFVIDADDFGKPEHFDDDADRWAGLTSSPPSSVEGAEVDEFGVWEPRLLAELLRVSNEEARAIRRTVATSPDSRAAEWSRVADRLAEQWGRDARLGWDVLCSM